MAGNTVIIVAQAEPSAPAEELHVEGQEPAPEGAHVTDETHATTEHAEDAHSDVFPPFDPASFGGQLIWLAITFAALYLIMSRAALPRIGGILEQRQTRISGDLREAERLQGEAEAAGAAYEAALAQARANAQTIAQETRDSIKADIANKRQGVEADLGRKVTDAEAAIATSKGQAMQNVSAIAAETAAALTERLSAPVSVEEARAAVAIVVAGNAAR
jgi:F-type H+-transporting ATPase subunit b